MATVASFIDISIGVELHGLGRRMRSSFDISIVPYTRPSG